MSTLSHFRLLLPVMLLVGTGVPLSLRAQTLPVLASKTPDRATDLPVVHSPLGLFRELLGMSPAQREAHLAQWSPEKRARLLAKIHEYEAMTPEAREQSLVATELHWYLQRFLPGVATNQTIQLTQVPEPYRKMVGDRLMLWKILPPPLQQDVLAHETTRDFFLLGGGARTSVTVPPEIIPPPLRQELFRLEGLEPERRRQSYANFQNFFELTGGEKQSVLDAIPATERQQFEKTIAELQRLPKEQRELGLRSLGQLAGMSVSQRREFLNNIARWKQLPPEERELWLKVNSHLPPMPPLPPPFPPLPGVSLATNPR